MNVCNHVGSLLLGSPWFSPRGGFNYNATSVNFDCLIIKFIFGEIAAPNKGNGLLESHKILDTNITISFTSLRICSKKKFECIIRRIHIWNSPLNSLGIQHAQKLPSRPLNFLRGKSELPLFRQLPPENLLLL